MNQLFVLLGIESWKPLIGALLMPPVPLLLAVLVGVRLIPWRRGVGWLVVLLSVALLWLSACAGFAELLLHGLVKPPPALDARQVASLRQTAAATPTAIVVLGGGRVGLAPEYGVSSLGSHSLERLRYGIWLARETRLPLGFSGGIGHAQRGDASEAETAARIAAREFGQPLRWAEDRSRDTRENAAYTVALLKPLGIRRVVLVSHASHLPRALRDFAQAAEAAGLTLELVPAPVGLGREVDHPVLRWMPSEQGFRHTRWVLHELMGRLAGA